MIKVNTIYGQGVIADFNDYYATIYLDAPVAFYSNRYGRTILEDVITLSVNDPTIAEAIETLLDEQVQALIEEMIEADADIILK